MVEFLRKSESRSDKIAWIKIALSNISMYFNFVQCWGPCNVNIMKLTARAQSIYREVHGRAFDNHCIALLFLLLLSMSKALRGKAKEQEKWIQLKTKKFWKWKQSLND